MSAVAIENRKIRRAAPLRTGRVASTLRVLLLAFLFFMRDGVPAAFIGLPPATTNYIVAIICLLGFAKWALFDSHTGKTPYKVWLPILFLGYCVLVAAFSSTFIFHYAWREWVIGQYLIAPILAPVLYFTLGYRLNEIVLSILIAAVGASLLIVLDHFVPLAQLDIYHRRSVAAGDDFRRIVIMKNEIAWAFVYFMVRIALNAGRGRSWRAMPAASIVLFVLTGFVLFVFLESRLAIAAVLAAACLFLVIARVGVYRRIFLVAAAFLFALSILPLALEKYFDVFVGSDDYLATANVAIRVLELEFFWAYFLQTWGVGFGVLSAGPDFSNFIAWSGHYMVPGYDGFGVQDLGLAGALLQFGVVGLVWVVAINLACLRRFLKAARESCNPNRLPAITSFCYMLGFLLSPLPMNFFTLGWTVFFGWTLWYMSFAVHENGS